MSYLNGLLHVEQVFMFRGGVEIQYVNSSDIYNIHTPYLYIAMLQ